MLLPALAAACMPAHAEALNDLSSMPPVSVTMQPRNLPVAAAVVPELAVGLVAPAAGAEVWLLPHAAITTDADTASAAVAHALCFTLTSTGPARYCAWPRIRPRLTRRLFLVGLCWEGDTRPSGLLVAESEPDHDGGPGLSDRDPGSARRVFGAFVQGRDDYRLARSCADEGYSAPVLFGPVLSGPVLFGAGTPGNSRMAVSPPPGVSVSLAVPPFEVTRRCTMARPSPVPFGLDVVKRRKARSLSSGLMPGPSSATAIRAPAVIAVVVTVTCPPALSASSALAMRLSSTCSRWPSPIQASTGERVPHPLPPASLPPSPASSTMPRSSATGCHATTRSLATSATSTAAGTGTTFSARAPAGRPSPRPDSP